MTRRSALAMLLAALALGAPQVAFAHTITRVQVRSAAREAARTIKTQTRAESASVLSCRRLSEHRARCGVETRYSSGASRCVTRVGIRLVGSTTRWRVGESTCY